MISFDTKKRLLTQNHLMIMKLSSSQQFNFPYYENSFRDYRHPKDGTYRKDHTFLGFLEDRSMWQIGFRFEDMRFVAVHKFQQNWDWEDAGPLERHVSEIPWVLVFQGCDDISYYDRFETEEQLDDDWSRTDYFSGHSELRVLN